MNSLLGSITLSQKRAKQLNLGAHRQLSPALEKCCLRLCAQNSYQQAQDNVETLMGLRVGHSSLHRLVNKVELPLPQSEEFVEAASIDGGKIRLRDETTRRGKWRDYKAVSLHQGVCAAFFQSPEELQKWSHQQPLSPLFTCLGDGHDGVWNIADEFGGGKIIIRRQVLDWYHLRENLYKVKVSRKRLEQVESLLWVGQVEAAIEELKGLRRHQAQCFQDYLQRHRHRLPNYAHYQRLGIAIGSGSVESKIKQIGARVKISGAMWNKENVPQILRLRCAYLNNSPCLSICA